MSSVRSAVLACAGGAGVVLAIWAGALGLWLPDSFGAEFDVRLDSAVEAVAQVMPAVVNIGTETIVAVRDPFEDLLQEFWAPYHRRRPFTTTQYSLGSGVIIDEAGYLITNDHVVRRATRIRVRIGDEAGSREYEAKLVGESSRNDIAMLKIEARPGERFRTVRFAADDDLLLGETVLALGNPFGLGGSVSRGILSSKSRRPALENTPMGIEDWLQTDAAIDPGNSGGPLINLRGELIGLSIAVYREGQGIGFAIPIKRITEALLEIASPELRQYWFGARVRPGGSTLAVSSLEEGSPAEAAGLKPDDMIVGINGRATRGFLDFIKELSAAGDERDIALTLRRGSDRRSVTLRMVRAGAVFNAALIRRKLGLAVQEISPELSGRLGLADNAGLVIADVDRTGPASEARLSRGAIIVAVDGRAPEGVVESAKYLYGKKKGDTVGLEVLVQRRRGMVLTWESLEIALQVQ